MKRPRIRTLIAGLAALIVIAAAVSLFDSGSPAPSPEQTPQVAPAPTVEQEQPTPTPPAPEPTPTVEQAAAQTEPPAPPTSEPAPTTPTEQTDDGDDASGLSTLSVQPEHDPGNYDRDNWGFRSPPARARLGCTSAQHLDHIVALKEAYESGGYAWPAKRKTAFANDPLNQWCLAAGANLSKGARDIAEWTRWTAYITRPQWCHIASVTVEVKRKYALTIDAHEEQALAAALQSGC